MTVASKLSQLTKTWKKVQPVQPSFSNVSDGDYVGDLKEMKLTEAKKSGRLQVESSYEIADGEFAGKAVKRFDGIEEETGMGYFKGYCEVIGMEIPEDLELLQETMDAFVAGNTDLFNLTVRINNGYANVYVNGVSEFTKAEEGEGGEEVAEEQVEEVVEEVVEEQEVTPPPTTRRTITKPVAKPVAKPVVTPTPIRKVGTIRK